MTDSKATEKGRKFLVDYLAPHEKLQAHLGYVVAYLNNEISFMHMLRHARGLPSSNSSSRECKDYEDLVGRLRDREVEAVKLYMISLGAYLTGGPSDAVTTKARKLIRTKPMPESLKIPKDSIFYKGEPGTTLADMRRIV